MNFLIQTFDGKIEHDFSFTLVESCKYNNWFRNDPTLCTVAFTDNAFTEGVIPVGSVEFVIAYLEKYFNKTPKPINVPISLFKYAGREIGNGIEKDIHGTKFVKSNDSIKFFAEFCSTAPPGNYQISEKIDNIKSEWRAFVYGDKLVGLQNYSGDFTLFPDLNTITAMIRDYVNPPIAYTLDVGIADTYFENKKIFNNTIIIEVHDFFSCGFYGFAEHKYIPYMFASWFNKFIEGTKL